MKKDPEASFWPRLTKDKVKLHYLKTDFNRWKDEDDTESEPEQDTQNFDLDSVSKDLVELKLGKASFENRKFFILLK